MDADQWDERYRTGEYSPRDYPSALLSANAEWLPGGRALDVATGTGRNAMFLAEQGYSVDAVDFSSEALRVARETAKDRGIEVSWIHADLADFDAPEATYDLVNVSFYYDLNLIATIKKTLTVGGVLVYEHHLQPASIVDRGPSTNRFRFRSNDLLRACLDLTVLEYRERIHTYERGERAGETAAIASIIARNGTRDEQWYPPE